MRKTMEDGAGVLDAWMEGRTAVVRLNRPDVHNALDGELTERLGQALTRIDADPAARAILLTGSGSSFCSGDDLRTVRDADGPEFRRSILGLQELTASVLRLRKPVVCALNGPAYGAGLELVLACDARVATPDFLCATPEVKLGLIATNAASVLLPQLVGAARARRMLLTGAQMDAAWCLDAGLVDEIVPRADLMPRALSLAAEFALAGPDALAATRRLLVAPLEAMLSAALAAESESCIAARESTEGREGVAAYFADRPPEWRLA